MKTQQIVYALSALSFFIAAIKAMIKPDPQRANVFLLIDFVALGFCLFVVAFALLQ